MYIFGNEGDAYTSHRLHAESAQHFHMAMSTAKQHYILDAVHSVRIAMQISTALHNLIAVHAREHLQQWEAQIEQSTFSTGPWFCISMAGATAAIGDLN